MTNSDIGAPESKISVRATAADHFAWIRTRLALERTLMSWVRTAVSLIGFGFAIVQFFDRLQKMPEARAALLPDAPQYLGLALIFCGVLALVISLWQYRSIVRYLWTGPFASIAGIENIRMPPAAIATAILLILIGLFALFAVLLRLT
jgi:putative membrane protein